jgi:hypothetical protein
MSRKELLALRTAEREIAVRRMLLQGYATAHIDIRRMAKRAHCLHDWSLYWKGERGINIDVEVVATDLEMHLSPNGCKRCTEFEQELGEVMHQRGFDVAFEGLGDRRQATGDRKSNR